MFKLLTLVLLGVALLSLGSLANDTALHDGRFGPEPVDSSTGTESSVRMVREHIQVRFGYQYSEVHCTFVFRNTAEAAVEHMVGFPDIGAACVEMMRREPAHAEAIKERVNTSRLQNLQTRVDGKLVDTTLQFGNVMPGADADGTAVWTFDKQSGVRAWHVVRTSFAPGKDVTIERRYRLANATSALGVAFFEYTTATGAPWHGTIGKLEVDVTLSDEGLTADGLVWLGAHVGNTALVDDLARFTTQPSRSGWQVSDNTHLRLVWTDFEPRTEKNRRGFTLARTFHGF